MASIRWMLAMLALGLWPGTALAQELPEPEPDVAREPPSETEDSAPTARFPVEGPHRFSDDFGAPRSGGRTHQGTDIFAEKMIPVVAVADGVVERVGVSSLGGNYVAVRHQDGWSTVYIHLNNDNPGTDDGAGGPEHAFAPGIVPGAQVKAGDVLGWVGDSGNAEETPPHLHFEVRTPGGKSVNSYQQLLAAASAPLPVGSFLQGEGTLPHTGDPIAALAGLGGSLLALGSALLRSARGMVDRDHPSCRHTSAGARGKTASKTV